MNKTVLVVLGCVALIAPVAAVDAPSRQLGILTPPESPAPRINGPSVFGVRPGHPILYRLPVTGDRPMKLAVEGLPEGATFDAASGLLGGTVSKPGDYPLVAYGALAEGTTFTLDAQGFGGARPILMKAATGLVLHVAPSGMTVIFR